MCKTNQERRTLGRKIVSWLSFGVFVALNRWYWLRQLCQIIMQLLLNDH